MPEKIIWEPFTEFIVEQNSPVTNLIYLPQNKINEVKKYSFIAGQNNSAGPLAARIEMLIATVTFKIITDASLAVGETINFSGELYITHKERVRIYVAAGGAENVLSCFACGLRYFF